MQLRKTAREAAAVDENNKSGRPETMRVKSSLCRARPIAFRTVCCRHANLVEDVAAQRTVANETRILRGVVVLAGTGAACLVSRVLLLSWRKREAGCCPADMFLGRGQDVGSHA